MIKWVFKETGCFYKGRRLQHFRCFHKEKEKIEKEENSIINYRMILGLKKIDINNLSSLCRDFHNIFRINKYELLKYAYDILPFIKYLRTSEIVMILHHYSYVNYSNINFYNNIWIQIKDKLYDIDCKELALVIYSMGKIKYTNKDMILFFEKEIKKWLLKFTGRDCSLILKGLQNIPNNNINNKIYDLIYEHILNNIDALNILDICIILNTHSKSINNNNNNNNNNKIYISGSNNTSNSKSNGNNINLRLFEALLNKSLTYYTHLNEQCIGSLLWSISNADIKAEKYFSLLARRLRIIMNEKLIRDKIIVNQDTKEDDNMNIKSNHQIDNTLTDVHLSHCDNNINNDDNNFDNIYTNNYEDGNYQLNKDSYNNHSDNLNYQCNPLNNKNTCHHENVIPSIIYSFGKQRVYMKHHIDIDKNIYNHIINNYPVYDDIPNKPVEKIYMFDFSKKFLRDQNVFNNVVNNENVNNNSNTYKIIKKYKSIKKNNIYYQDIIYIINNFLIHFLNKIHYNDLKNILFGITKIEMSINKILLNNIYELITLYTQKGLYKNYEVINLLRSLTLIPYFNKDIWIHILDFYKKNFLTKHTNIKNHSYLLYIYSFVQNQLQNYPFHHLLIQHINKNSNMLQRDDVIYIIKAFLNSNYYDNQLVNNIFNFIQTNFKLFNIIDIVYILKYCTIHNLRNTNIFSLFALTIKEQNRKANNNIIYLILSFYLEMDIYPKIIEDLLMEVKQSKNRNYCTEEIQCDQ
ncbi:conserved Plasmodium protein, unknown function [Plasmodium gaboni]|uniref:Heptatricopeptide repeat-containing protein n=1 Tax=Plasmodium gaboni TaxID=647221 RepID=A0ABY1UMQ6_9APIC|nr:conserved Plasmodium protein, unknown function [Plasmodium gaboni]